MSEQYDIAVIGSGPAGSNAAITASGLGARVVVLDEQSYAGGQVWRAKSAAIAQAPNTPETLAGNTLRDTLTASNATHLADTRVWQIEREGKGWAIHILTAGKTIKVLSKALVLATGAREYVHPIPGWTTPGVIGLAGATALFKQELTLPGKATVVSGTGPLVFFVASEIRRLGGTVAAIATPNTRRDWARALPAMLARLDLMRRGAIWMADLILARVPIYWGHAASAVQGHTEVSAVSISKLDATGAPVGNARDIQADSLCMGNGLIPAIEAAQLAGVSIKHRPELGGWVPNVETDGSTDIEGLFICGDGAGIRGVAAAEIHGILTGQTAASYLGKVAVGTQSSIRQKYSKAARFGMAMTALSVPKAGYENLSTPDTIICRCESLTQQSVAKEIASGAQSANAVKSGLRAGMGPCGGKFCQTAIAALVARTNGGSVAEVPPPTPRPPLRPVPTAALAGDFDYDDLPIPKPAPL
ncbi:FAD-dependent oxidoreductase [Sulfitobacter sp. AS92]|uniref:FAD-dependent oxidoreductase n=1 Tax=Sulfitobacter sp. AS92 TaxID=3135783 RepID=UPI003179E668